MRDHATANHLAPIRPFLIDSGIRRGVCARRLVQKILHRVIARSRAPTTKNARAACAVDATKRGAMRDAQYVAKNPYFIDVFCNRAHSACEFARACVDRVVRVVATSRRVRARRAFARAHTHFVKWSRCFFRCAVVNGMQCGSIRERTDATPAMSIWLGGQQWRNVERRQRRAAKKKGRKKRL